MPAKRGLLRVWNEEAGLWEPKIPKSWDGYDWSVPPGDYTFAYRTPFYPDYLGEGSVLQRSVAAMPLHTNSVEQATWMADNINYGAGFGPTSFNSSANNTHPIVCYVIDSTVGNTDMAWMDCGGPGADGGQGEELLSGWVPWPSWVDISTLQPGQDSAVTFYDIGTGVLREYYLVTAVDGYKNKYTALTAGYRIYPRGSTRWADSDISLQLERGSSAVVAFSNHLGWVDLSSARKGVINHALCFTSSNLVVPDSTGEAIRLDGTRYQWKGPSWPAKYGDGDSIPTDDNIPIHGQWARLPPDYDTSGFRPFLRMMLEAIKTYGMVCTDSNNFVHAFNFEPAWTERHFFGTDDPWTGTGDVYQMYNQLNISEGYLPDTPFHLDAFPWGDTEWAPRNWGKPE